MAEQEYLSIKNWAKYQSGKKGWDWIKDYVNQNDEKELARLSLFERGLLQELRRLRGRSGKNLPNDATHIAGAINAKGTDRARIGNALVTLIEQKILVLTNQEHDFVEEKRREEIRGEEIKEKEPARKAPAKQPTKVQAISPETSSVQAVMYLPLNSGDEFGISAEDFGLWKRLYPGVDVMQELRKMVGWCHSNPTKRKTRSGVKKFINSWLARKQDESGQQNFRSGNGQARRPSKADDRERRIIEDAFEFAGTEPSGSAHSQSAGTLALPGNGQAGIPGLARDVELIPPERDSRRTELHHAKSAKA